MKEGILRNISQKEISTGTLTIVQIDDEDATFFEDSDVYLDGIEIGDKVEYRTEENNGNKNLTEISLLEKDTEEEWIGTTESSKIALNSTKALARLRSQDEYDLEDFIEERDKLARSTAELIEELGVEN